VGVVRVSAGTVSNGRNDLNSPTRVFNQLSGFSSGCRKFKYNRVQVGIAHHRLGSGSTFDNTNTVLKFQIGQPLKKKFENLEFFKKLISV
jgi:peptidyl-tRNA hydrolase